MAIQEHTSVAAEDSEKIARIRWSRIRRNKKQPRVYINRKKLEELAASIKENGQKVPIIVKRVRGDPNHDYEIVDGERRWRACEIAGVETILAVMRGEMDEEEQFEQSIIANLCREGHTDLEIAWSIERMEKFRNFYDLNIGKQMERIGKAFGRSSSWVRDKKKLLRLHPDVQAMMAPVRGDGSEIPDEELLNGTVATYISSMHHDLQLKIAKAVLEKKMTLNQARSFARRVAEEEGTQAGNLVTNAPGLPATSWRRLRTLVRTMKESLDVLSAAKVQEALKKRDPQRRVLMATELEGCITELSTLKEVLLDARAVKETRPLAPISSPKPPTSPPVSNSRVIAMPEPRRPKVERLPEKFEPAERISAAPRVLSQRERKKQEEFIKRLGRPTHALLSFEDPQPLELSHRVLQTIFYSGEELKVNLSRSRLTNAIGNGENPDALVENAVKSGEHRWHSAPQGSVTEQKFIRLVSRIRHDLGDPRTFDDAMSRALKEDESHDPVLI